MKFSGVLMPRAIPVAPPSTLPTPRPSIPPEHRSPAMRSSYSTGSRPSMTTSSETGGLTYPTSRMPGTPQHMASNHLSPAYSRTTIPAHHAVVSLPRTTDSVPQYTTMDSRTNVSTYPHSLSRSTTPFFSHSTPPTPILTSRPTKQSYEPCYSPNTPGSSTARTSYPLSTPRSVPRNVPILPVSRPSTTPSSFEASPSLNADLNTYRQGTPLHCATARGSRFVAGFPPISVGNSLSLNVGNSTNRDAVVTSERRSSNTEAKPEQTKNGYLINITGDDPIQAAHKAAAASTFVEGSERVGECGKTSKLASPMKSLIIRALMALQEIPDYGNQAPQITVKPLPSYNKPKPCIKAPPVEVGETNPKLPFGFEERPDGTISLKVMKPKRRVNFDFMPKVMPVRGGEHVKELY